MPEADEGDSLCPLAPLTKRLLWLSAPTPPPLAVVEAAAVEVVVEGVVEEVTPNGALALECDLPLVMIIKERVRRAVRWDVRISTKEKDLFKG